MPIDADAYYKEHGYPKTKEIWCEYLKSLDEKYQTDELSPLHHDQRCPIHGKRAKPKDFDWQRETTQRKD